jgi:multidrug resistance efflux pump
VPVIVLAGVLGAVSVLWPVVQNQGTFVGAGEGVRSLITAPQNGVVQTWLVEPYSLVRQGDPVAVFNPTDPRVRMDLLRSQIDIARIHSQPSLAEENAMNYERIRVELLKTRSDLAVARVKLRLAEKDVARNTPLYHEKLLSEDLYELSVNLRDALEAEVKEKSQAAAEIEQRLSDLRQIGEPGAPTRTSSELAAQLEQFQRAAATNLGQITLVAPIAGRVGPPLRQAGETVVSGEPLLPVNALWADRIVGYLRQPYVVDPEPGMPVVVTTRNRKRLEFPSRIVQVGAQVESITNALAYVRQGFLFDSGLPLVVEIPPESRIRPGELVDVLIDGRAAPESSPPQKSLGTAKVEP